MTTHYDVTPYMVSLNGQAGLNVNFSWFKRHFEHFLMETSQLNQINTSLARLGEQQTSFFLSCAFFSAGKLHYGKKKKTPPPYIKEVSTTLCWHNIKYLVILSLVVKIYYDFFLFPPLPIYNLSHLHCLPAHKTYICCPLYAHTTLLSITICHSNICQHMLWEPQNPMTVWNLTLIGISHS